MCFLLQEWDLFTGLIVADVKESGGHGDRPGWVEEDRLQAVALLKVGHPCSHLQAGSQLELLIGTQKEEEALM